MASELMGDGKQTLRSGECLAFVPSQVKQFQWGGEFSLGGEGIQTLSALPFCCLDVAGCWRSGEGWEPGVDFIIGPRDTETFLLPGPRTQRSMFSLYLGRHGGGVLVPAPDGPQNWPGKEG